MTENSVCLHAITVGRMLTSRHMSCQFLRFSYDDLAAMVALAIKIAFGALSFFFGQNRLGSSDSEACLLALRAAA